MEEAFTKIVVANSGRMDGDGVRANQLPTAMEPVLPKPAPKSFGLLAQYPEEGDSVSIAVTTSQRAACKLENRNKLGTWRF